MFSSAYSAPQASFVSNAIDHLKFILPNLVASVAISIVGSVMLTGISYALTASLGFPVMPFFFIMV